jgi:pilus assembly protein CpaE
MAQLTASIVSHDDEFKRQIARMLRACGVPLGIMEGRVGADGSHPDLAVVDLRTDLTSGMAAIERLRGNNPAMAVFAVAATAEPDLILQAMRAGANEFFAWTAGAQPGGGGRSMEESFQTAVRRTAARREAVSASTKQACVTKVFLGAKGGTGTTTIAVNCAVELARLSKKPTIIVDLKPCLGEVALFLGVRPRFTVMDALENLHRLDRDFLKELVTKHKTGLDILAGSEQFEPSGEGGSSLEELLRVLGRTYEYIVIDAGSMITSFAMTTLYTADTVFLVTNPDVPSIRNAQRMVERIRQVGAGGERVKILLNRVSDQNLIAPKQIETALGYSIYHSFTSDYRAVSTALNSGVPLALSNSSELAQQLSNLARQLLGQEDEAKEPERRRAFLGLL